MNASGQLTAVPKDQWYLTEEALRELWGRERLADTRQTVSNAISREQ